MRTAIRDRIRREGREILTKEFPINADALEQVVVIPWENGATCGRLLFFFSTHPDVCVVLQDVEWSDEGEILLYRHAEFEIAKSKPRGLTAKEKNRFGRGSV